MTTPRFSSTTTTEVEPITQTRAAIDIPAGATAVHISTTEEPEATLPIYIGPTDDDNTGLEIGSKTGDDLTGQAHLYLELAPNAKLYGNNSSTRSTTNVNFVWFYV